MRDVHESFNNQENVSEKISPKQSVSVDYVAWTIVVLSIALFVPLMVGADFHLQGSEEEINARSVECRSFAIASLSICISLLIDLLLDISFTEIAANVDQHPSTSSERSSQTIEEISPNTCTAPITTEIWPKLL